VNIGDAFVPATVVMTLDAEPGQFAFYGWNNITIIVWVVQPSAAAIERLMQVGERRGLQHPEGLSDVHLIVGQIKLPDAAARDRLLKGAKRAAPHLAAVAAVAEGQGFWLSTLRSVITGIRVLLPGSFALRLFVDVDELALWLPDVHEKATGVRVTSAALRKVL
jgi:hypothetical protein